MSNMPKPNTSASQYSNRTSAHDDQIMTFGKHKGERLADVPDEYLLWLTGEGWFKEKYPDLYEYALLIE